jgi:nucleoside-diphosphate-sugar epimerase
MKFFVTGGTGFIGSYFLKAGLSEGHQIVALRRTEGSRPPIILESEGCKWLPKSMSKITVEDFQECDCLVHFAAAGVSPQKATWSELFDTNLVQSLRLWNTAADAGVQRFLICGSCFEYGKSGDHYDYIPVDAPLQPINGYAASKASASIAAMALAAERKLQLAILRPFHTYGEGQDERNFWPALRRAALSGIDFNMTAGEQIRDFQPVEEIAAAFLSAANYCDLEVGKPLIKNLGSGKPEMLKDFAARWWAHFNGQGVLRIGSLPYRDNEVMRYVPEIF